MSFKNMKSNVGEEDAGGGDGFPMIQIRMQPNKPAMKMGSTSVQATAGFYLAADNVNEEQSAELQKHGWVMDSIEPDDGDEFECLHNPQPSIIYLGLRQYWDKGTTMEVLCLMADAPELGLFKIHVRNTASMAFAAISRKGGLYTHQNISKHSTKDKTVRYEAMLVHMRVLTKAGKKILGSDVPRWAFRMNISTPKDKNGNLHLCTIGQGGDTSQVCIPQLVGVPHSADEVTEELLDELFVGQETLDLAESLILENADWFKEWDNYTPEDEQATGSNVVEASVEEAEAALSADGYDMD